MWPGDGVGSLPFGGGRKPKLSCYLRSPKETVSGRKKGQERNEAGEAFLRDRQKEKCAKAEEKEPVTGTDHMPLRAKCALPVQ